MIILETRRLILRLMTEEDIPPLIELWTDGEVTRFMGGPRDLDKITENLTLYAKNPAVEKFDLWPLIEKSTQEVIGNCGLLNKEVEGKNEIELIYVLAQSAWGKGYATEISLGLIGYAFNELDIDHLIALIEPENTQSEKVAKKIGMQFERTIIRPNGNFRKLFAIQNEIRNNT